MAGATTLFIFTQTGKDFDGLFLMQRGCIGSYESVRSVCYSFILRILRAMMYLSHTDLRDLEGLDGAAYVFFNHRFSQINTDFG